MSINIFIIKHPHHSGRNDMLDRCLTVWMGKPGRLCVGDRAGLPGLCVFLGNTSVLLTWAGTGRVDISVQLLVGLIILLHYKCRPEPLAAWIFFTQICKHILKAYYSITRKSFPTYVYIVGKEISSRI